LQRPREFGDFNGVGHFEAKFQVERLCFMPISMDRYMEKWFYYNSAAESFHMKKLCSRLYLTEIEFYSKNKKVAF